MSLSRLDLDLVLRTGLMAEIWAKVCCVLCL